MFSVISRSIICFLPRPLRRGHSHHNLSDNYHLSSSASVELNYLLRISRSCARFTSSSQDLVIRHSLGRFVGGAVFSVRFGHDQSINININALRSLGEVDVNKLRGCGCSNALQFVLCVRVSFPAESFFLMKMGLLFFFLCFVWFTRFLTDLFVMVELFSPQSTSEEFSFFKIICSGFPLLDPLRKWYCVVWFSASCSFLFLF